MSDADELIHMLRARTTSGLFREATHGEFVLPHYQGYSIANVPATVAQLLGVPIGEMLPPLEDHYWKGLHEGVRRVVLILLDALGYLALQKLFEGDSVWRGLAAQGRMLPMTSVVPSTTATALATLMTGRSPLEHQLLGYELWLRRYGVLTDMLNLKPVYGADIETLLDWGLEPERFLPVPGLGTRLTAAGVHSCAIIRHIFRHSALTRMCYRGFQQVEGYTGLVDLWVTARRTLSKQADRLFCFVYWGGIDTAIHRYGSAKGLWARRYAQITAAFKQWFLDQLKPSDREGTLLIMCADHGFVDTPEEAAHDTERDPILAQELLIPFSGESRAAFLHCQRGAHPRVRQRIWKALGDGYEVVPMVQAITEGLFGPGTPSPEAWARLGHFFVAARGARYLDRLDRRSKIRGRHGGLSPQEMLVPWLAVRLDG